MSSARYVNENQDQHYHNGGSCNGGGGCGGNATRDADTFCNGGQMQVISCGNDRGINDLWSTYNQLWQEARYYYTRLEHQLVYVQQAPRRPGTDVSYNTWKWFFDKQVKPRAPNDKFQWLVTPSMPFIFDERRTPGKDRFSQEWIDYVIANPMVSYLYSSIPCQYTHRSYPPCQRY